MATVHVGANADPHPSITMHGSPYNNCEHLIGSGAGSIVLPKRQNYELSFNDLSRASAPRAHGHDDLQVGGFEFADGPQHTGPLVSRELQVYLRTSDDLKGIS
jgi:hypothetical protein